MTSRPDRTQRLVDLARLRRVRDRIDREYAQPLDVEALARGIHVSAGHLSRAFRAETGQSPAKAVEHLRVEAARLMMEEGRHSMDVIANETGFADRERMRRAFLRVLGQPPQSIRRHARAAA